MKTVAIVGRTNVGKSTLFNRLCGRKFAIVHDEPGVTRDRKEAEASLYDLSFRLIDTAGLEDTTALAQAMWRQTEMAVEEADVVLAVVDARSELTRLDEQMARDLRKSHKPVLLIANKCEGKITQNALGDFYRLGLGDPIPVSGEHGLGMGDLHEALSPLLKEKDKTSEKVAKIVRAQKNMRYGDNKKMAERFADETAQRNSETIPTNAEQPSQSSTDADNTDFSEKPELYTAEHFDMKARERAEKQKRPLKLAIVGRPNVGKSTLVNQLLGKERLLTGPEAGVTRDAITIPWEWRGRSVLLTDTAGLRKRGKVEHDLEKISAADTRNAIDFAEVVILVLDANVPMEKQDLLIASKVLEEGRTLLIALNKWDSVPNQKAVLNQLKEKMAVSLQQVKGLPIHTISAKTGYGLDRLMSDAFKMYELWNKRVPTHKLNDFLKRMTEAHPTPIASNGKRIPMKYMTQVSTRPPTFVIFSSNPDSLPESYLRYLSNGIREQYGLVGVPIRIYMRKRENPYAEKAKERRLSRSNTPRQTKKKA